jgi:hypothetical protein
MDIDDILVPAVIVPVAIVVVLLVGVGVAVFTMVLGKKKGRGLDSWARAAYAIWTGGEDSATWTPDRAQSAFKNWYGANSGGQAQNVIEGLIVDGQTNSLAWDKVRALDLVRIALAARYIDEDQSRAYIARIGQLLQRSHQGWEHLAQSFEQGMQAWHHRQNVTDPKETQRVQRNLPTLRAQIWPQIPWATTLVAPD